MSSVCGTSVVGSEWHLNRGRAVHKAIALHLLGRLDESSVDPRIVGKVNGAKKCIREHGLTLGACPPETPDYHPLYLFAGTPDFLSANGVLVEFKSSHARETEVQLGFQVLLFEQHGIKVKKCMEVVLNDDGGYTPSFFKPARCKGLALAAYTLHAWRKGAK